MNTASLRESLGQVGLALREPEQFVLAWRRGERAYRSSVWLALGITAACGTLSYGLTLGLHGGALLMLERSLLLTLSAGLAWAIPLPALYILNCLGGSRLRASTTLLAALVTTSWGGLALMASIPINWFFNVSLWRLAPTVIELDHARWLVMGINAVVFAGVGVSMVDVFARTIERVEPENGRRPVWFLALVGAIGAQLAFLFGLLG